MSAPAARSRASRYPSAVQRDKDLKTFSRWGILNVAFSFFWPSSLWHTSIWCILKTNDHGLRLVKGRGGEERAGRWGQQPEVALLLLECAGLEAAACKLERDTKNLCQLKSCSPISKIILKNVPLWVFSFVFVSV